MPHCILEYSSNVIDAPNCARLLLDIHEVLMATGLFVRADIKSRIVEHERYVIGDGSQDQAFVTLNVQMLSGGSDETKRQIAEAALDLLSRAFAKTLDQLKCSISVQITDIHRPSYSRRISYADE
jgi:5-carboxymethyl-2-hydroxymuconate isomerase